MIDLTYLNDITDGDPDSMSQLIELFIGQTGEIMDNFHAAQSNGNVEEIGRIAHLAKSTSKVMGISDVSEKMQELQGLVDRHEHAEMYGSLVEYYYREMPGNIALLRKALAEIHGSQLTAN